MSFCSTNELSKFGYNDCQLFSINVSEHEITMELEALIVRYDNSQNTNYTDSYASTATLKLCDAALTRVVKDGYRRYDANDNLLEEVPDEEILSEDVPELLKSLDEAFLYGIDELSGSEAGTNQYTLLIEVPGEDMAGCDSTCYHIYINATSSTIKWEHYLNRVQN